MRKPLILLCISILVIALVPASAVRKTCSLEDGCDQLVSPQDLFDRDCNECINTAMAVLVLLPLLDAIPSFITSRAPPIRASIWI